MVRTLEAASDERGSVRLLEVVELQAARRGLVTIRPGRGAAGAGAGAGAAQ